MSLGVIVGRFQVPELHDGHKALIETVAKTNTRVLIFLACSRAYLDKRNPLDFETRRLMIARYMQDSGFNHYNIVPIYDTGLMPSWDQNLDLFIAQHQAFGESVVIYAGRDNWLHKYRGRYKTCSFTESHFPTAIWEQNGTAIRSQVACTDSPEFRKGVIYGRNQWNRDFVFPTVDMAVVTVPNLAQPQHYQVLLGQKAQDNRWRLPGGFVDTTDQSWEHAASRELQEETGLKVSPEQWTYVCSQLGNDWRYPAASKGNRIITTLFKVDVIQAMSLTQAGDDLVSLNWFSLERSIFSDDNEDILGTHKVLLKYLYESFNLP